MLGGVWDGDSFYLARVRALLTPEELANVVGLPAMEIYLAEREEPPDEVQRALGLWLALHSPP